jgi:hypothetical protein
MRMGKVTAKDLEGPEFQGCGLRMIVMVPDEVPESLRGLPVDEMFRKLREMVLEEAIRRWNTRSN